MLLALALSPGVALAEEPKPVDAKLAEIEGGGVRLSDYRGGPVLLELWATWCLPCREQAKVLHELGERFSERGIRVLAVNEGEGPGVVRKFLLSESGWYPVLLDRGRVLARLFDVPELPAIVLLDAEGRLLGVERGLADTETVLELLAAAGH